MRRRWGVVWLFGCALALAPVDARAQSDAVTIRDNAYAPTSISIRIGESVTWTNEGNNPHTVTSDGFFDSSPSCLSGVGVGCMGHGDQFTLTFDTAGTFQYTCKIHGQAMTGSVTVESATTTSSVGGTTSTTTTSTSTTTTLTSSSAPPGQASQQTPPTFPNGSSRSALPKPVGGRDADDDDDTVRTLVLIDVLISGMTAFVGVVLVRKGRLPFG